MSKVTKNERISTLEDAVAMNWSDMKKIETKISRAMTDMATRISNISLQLEGQQRQIHLAADSIGLNKQAIIMLENEREAEAEPEPQLKQLDQSVFDGLDEKWRFAAVDSDTSVYTYEARQHIEDNRYWVSDFGMQKYIGKGYDASNWQNSLIERESKELLEVDLSSELTGSDYYYSNLVTERLENGQELVMCFVSNVSELDAMQERHVEVITSVDTELNDSDGYGWQYAIPINNQGEPLTAAEVGL